jgi:hypothetical protein
MINDFAKNKIGQNSNEFVLNELHLVGNPKKQTVEK